MRCFKIIFDSSLEDTETLSTQNNKKKTRHCQNATNNLLFCVCKITQNKIKYFPVTTQSRVMQETLLFCWTLHCNNTSLKFNYKYYVCMIQVCTGSS